MPKASSSLDTSYKPNGSSSSISKPRARKRVKVDHPINSPFRSPGKSVCKTASATYDEKKDAVYLHFAGVPRSSYYACLLNTRFIPSHAGMDPKELVRNGGRDDVGTALRNAEIFGTPPARRVTKRVEEGTSLNWFPWPLTRPGEGYSEVGTGPRSSDEGYGDIWAGPPISFLDDDVVDVNFGSPPRAAAAADNANRAPSPTPTRGSKPSLSQKKKVSTQPTQRKRTIIPGSPILQKKGVGRPKQSPDQSQVKASRVKRDTAGFNQGSKATRSKGISQCDATQAEDDTPMFIQGSSSRPSSAPFRNSGRQGAAYQVDNDMPMFIQGSSSTSPTAHFGNSGRPAFDKEFTSTASPPRFETPTAEMDESTLYDYLYGFGIPIVKLPPSRFKGDTIESTPMDINDEPIVHETPASPVHLDYSDYLHQDELPPSHSQSTSNAMESATTVVNDEQVEHDTPPSPTRNGYANYLHPDELPPSQFNGDVIEGATAVVNDEEMVHESPPSPVHNDYSGNLHPDALPPSQPKSVAMDITPAEVNDLQAVTIPNAFTSPARNDCTEYLHPDDNLQYSSLGSPMMQDASGLDVSELMNELFGGPSPISDDELIQSPSTTPPLNYHGTIDPILLGGGQANDNSPLSDEPSKSAPFQLSPTCSPTRSPTPPPLGSISGPTYISHTPEADIEMEDAALSDKDDIQARSYPSTESSTSAKASSSSRSLGGPSTRVSAQRISTAPPKIVVWSVRPKDAKGRELPFPRRITSHLFEFPSGPSDKFCHQCRNRCGKLVMQCACEKHFCIRCIMLRYDDQVFPFDASAEDRPCPLCMDICNCTQCCSKRNEVYVSSRRACVRIVGEPDDLVLAPPPKLQPKSKPKPSLKRKASGSVSPPPERPQRAYKRPMKYRSPSPVPDFPVPEYRPVPLPTGPLAYWATIYGMSGQKLATAFTGGDADEVVIVKPIQPPTIMVPDQHAPPSTVPRRFVGRVQRSWRCGPDPYVTDVESDSPQGTRVKKKGKERQRKTPYARRFVGNPSLLYAKFKKDTSESPPLCKDSSGDIFDLRDSSPLTPVPTTPGSSDLEWVSWDGPKLPSSSSVDATKRSVSLEENDVARAIMLALSSTESWPPPAPQS